MSGRVSECEIRYKSMTDSPASLINPKPAKHSSTYTSHFCFMAMYSPMRRPFMQRLKTMTRCSPNRFISSVNTAAMLIMALKPIVTISRPRSFFSKFSSNLRYRKMVLRMPNSAKLARPSVALINRMKRDEKAYLSVRSG